MMIRRIATTVAIAGLAASGFGTTAPSASGAGHAVAAGSCSAYIPSRVGIGQPYRAVTIHAGPNCSAAAVDQAAWSGYHPTQGPQEFLSFERSSGYDDIWNLYSFDPLGRWQWRPEGAYDAQGNEVFQYGPYYTDVRLLSYGRVTATRSGSKVNVRTAAYRYWSGGEKFIGWAGARGQIQYRTAGGTPWHGLKDVYSTSSGTYSYTYPTSAVRDYRVVLYDAASNTIWGSISPVVRR